MGVVSYGMGGGVVGVVSYGIGGVWWVWLIMV